MKFQIGQIWINRIGEKVIIKHIDHIERKIICGVNSATTTHEYKLNYDGTYHNHKYDLVEFDNIKINDEDNVYMVINSIIKQPKRFTNLNEAKEYANDVNNLHGQTTFVVKLVNTVENKKDWNTLRKLSEYINQLLKQYKIYYRENEIMNSCIHECTVGKTVVLEMVDSKNNINIDTISDAKVIVDEFEFYEKYIIKHLLRNQIKQILE